MRELLTIGSGAFEMLRHACVPTVEKVACDTNKNLETLQRCLCVICSGS
jgi:hypothetical protein